MFVYNVYTLYIIRVLIDICWIKTKLKAETKFYVIPIFSTRKRASEVLLYINIIFINPAGLSQTACI